VDVFPTLCGLAGVAVPEGLDGSDLLACGRRDEAFSQYGRDNFLLRTGQWKYLRFAGAPEVVFDLVNDPAETRNLIASADHAGVVRSLRTRMDAFLAPTCESGQKPA
jgi:choline-sulfatase